MESPKANRLALLTLQSRQTASSASSMRDLLLLLHNQKYICNVTLPLARQAGGQTRQDRQTGRQTGPFLMVIVPENCPQSFIPTSPSSPSLTADTSTACRPRSLARNPGAASLQNRTSIGTGEHERWAKISQLAASRETRTRSRGAKVGGKQHATGTSRLHHDRGKKVCTESKCRSPMLSWRWAVDDAVLTGAHTSTYVYLLPVSSKSRTNRRYTNRLTAPSTPPRARDMRG